MKVIQRGTMKIVPGKMAEAMESMKEWTATTTRLGCPPFKCYQCISGKDDYMHTLICECEWDSFSAMEEYFDKMFADKDMQQLMAKWDALIDDHRIELLTPMPMGQ